VKHQAPTFTSAKYQIPCFFDFCSCKSLCKYFFKKYYFANYLKITLAEAKFGTLCCEEQYKEMGMTSVVFICYIRPDGKLAIDT